MAWELEFDRWAAEMLPGLEVRIDEPMSRHCSFRTGGGAKRMAFPKTVEEVSAVMEAAEKFGARPFVLGNGTNVLFPDEGLDRLVVNLTQLRHLAAGEDHTITAQAGLPLARLADFACQKGLAGLEFAHGIPGSLGGAVYMNGGAYGGEMSQVLKSVKAWFPGEGVREMMVEELDMSYRHSFFMDHPEAVILEATVSLTPGEEETIRAAMRELMARRKASQPLEYPSAGSTFKRPTGYFAGTLIDQCGLKGLTVGGAQVSEKHAGFIINIGGATSSDVTELMAQVQKIVWERKGVRLEPEVRVIR